MGMDEVDQCWLCKKEREQELKKQEQISKWLAEKLASTIRNIYTYSADEWLKIAEYEIIINNKNIKE